MRSLLGLRFGRLVVVSQNGQRADVRCDCGREKNVQVAHLNYGRTKSCGCLRAEMLSQRRLTHGRTETREYSSWCAMKARCYNPLKPQFEDWGGRGIKVCPQWIDSFETFFRDMGACPDGMSIDRIDNDGDYEPSNCRWATRQDQSNNQSRNVRITHDGKTQTVAEWSSELGIKYHTLYRRAVIKGEPPEIAFR